MRWLIVLVLVTVPAITALAEPADLSELLADPEAFSGQRLTVTGELVGDYSRRDEGVWVQVNDDPFVADPIVVGGEPSATSVGIGALIPTGEFDSVVVGPPGRYGRTGPVVELVGTFRYHDAGRGGETYLEVETVALVAPARHHPVPGPDRWLWIGSGLVMAAGSGAVVLRRKREPTEA